MVSFVIKNIYLLVIIYLIFILSLYALFVNIPRSPPPNKKKSQNPASITALEEEIMPATRIPNLTFISHLVNVLLHPTLNLHNTTSYEAIVETRIKTFKHPPPLVLHLFKSKTEGITKHCIVYQKIFYQPTIN